MAILGSRPRTVNKHLEHIFEHSAWKSVRRLQIWRGEKALTGKGKTANGKGKGVMQRTGANGSACRWP
jgi:hypothetical protein